ncbi:protein DDI1 homolog 2 isoform X1 [Pygocentrus nattereri]|uniref:protein DDI1 homolog 2 isoform X1 n=1 Tax=Pygocentrus nattereri TaxID=42514 RepID=UPI000814AD80|nr:protein DDI1 homolog 2 isoform X1 [Pygocentrus nattereri]
MLLTVFCAPRDRSETTFALEVSPDLELRDFLALCELESGIPAGEIQISYAEQPLRDLSRTLGNYGLKDGDVVVLRQAERRPPVQPSFPGLPRIDFSSIAVPGTSSNQHSTRQQPSATQSPPSTSPASSPQGLDNPTLLRDMLLANPHELSLLKERNPPLAEALLSGDLERFTKVLLEQQQDRARREQERIKLLTADPFDLEAQAKIEEDIRQHNIEENMTIAMEEAPESFGQVVMLYINCKVNGHPVKAFVDSGAQMTIMSQACAERCNIMRLVDRRWAGIAKGVGTQKIIGRVHLAQVQIEGDFLPCSFSILEDQPMDMLLGLDMLKRHQCSIDLKKSVLLIGTTGTETRFLPEAELPDCARLAYGPEGREDARPEEIADRELAEALHRSIQDSDTADGKTTSPQSPPLSLCEPFNIPTSSSASTSHTRSVALDRSKSAPASTHHSLPQETLFSPSQTQGETKSHPSDTHSMTEYHPSYTQDVPPSSPPQSLAESSQNPVHGLVDAFKPLSQPVTDSTLPNTEAAEALIPPVFPAQEPPLSSTVSKDNEVTSLVTCGESVNHLNVDVEEDITLQETKEPESPFTNLDTSSQTRDLLQEVDMADSTDAKTVSLDIPDQLQEKEQDSIMKNVASNQVQSRLNPVSELTFHHSLTGPADSSELPLVCSEFEENTDARSASKSAVPSERDQPEGDSIPSLAQALKELHELLMSNTHAQASGRSSSSTSHTTATQQDAEKGNEVRTTEDFPSLNPTVESLFSDTATTNEKTFAKSEHAAHEGGGTLDIPTLNSQGQKDDQTNRVANITVEQEMTQSLYTPGGNHAGGNGEGSVSEPGKASPLQGFFEFRESQESQQGRGDAEWRTSGTEPPNSAEPSQQRPLSVAVGSSTDNSSLVPVAPSHPSTQAPELAPLPFANSIQPSAVTLTEQYPAEHIQRIQAAGFSSNEAAEALDRAGGSVELALLVLLARKITVPT